MEDGYLGGYRLACLVVCMLKGFRCSRLLEPCLCRSIYCMDVSGILFLYKVLAGAALISG